MEVVDSKNKIVLFDFDGTLCDSKPYIFGAINELSKKHGFRPVEGEAAMDRLIQKGLKKSFASLGIKISQLPAIVSDMQKMMRANIEKIQLFPGIVEELSRLHSAGIALGVVSTNSLENIEYIFNKFSLSEKFLGIDGGASLFGKATRISRLKTVLKRKSKLMSPDFYYVGDEVRDMQAAKKSKCKSVAVVWGYEGGSENLLKEADFVLKNIGEMTPFFLS